jgi:LacI family transcriptional regulator
LNVDLALTSDESGTGGPRIRLKDIARELGVSTGTVERGLNGKRDVSPVTRARILAFAERVGYRPNLAARVLQSSRPFRVSIHLPSQGALFWGALREGILEAAVPFGPALQLDFRADSRSGEEIPPSAPVMAEGSDGLIVAPGDSAALAPQLKAAARRKIPVVYVGADAPASSRLISVSTDAFTVGAVAGELLARFLPGGGEVGLFTGSQATRDHAETLRGFSTSLSAVNPALKLGPLVEAHGDEAEVQRRTRAVLRACPGLQGLYISTRNSLSVLRAADREGRLAGLRVIATDLSAELVDLIRAGKVAATLDQRPLAQGQIALRSLYQLLQNPRRPPAPQRIGPGVVMASNLDLLLARRSAGRGSLDA